MHKRLLTRVRAVNIWLMAPLLGLSVFLVVLFSGSTPIAQAITASTNLNFQARLLTSTGAIVPDGNYNIDFKIYNADGTTGAVGTCTGACLWEETRLVASSQGVSVVNGYFSVNLGSVTAFPSTINWDQQLYLTMNVTTNGTASCTPATSCVWNGEMQNSGHSIALTSVPLAFRANQLAVAGTNEQVLQFASSTFGQTTTISLQDPGATTANICYETSGGAVNHTCAPATGSGNYIQNSTGGPQSANFNIISAASGSIGAIVHANASQSVDIFDVDNSSNTVLLGVGSDGSLTSSPTNTGTISLGTATQTGTITLGQATTAATQTINIESANGTSSAQTVNIGGGTSTTSGGKTVNIANGNPGLGTNNVIQIGTGGTTNGTVNITIGSNGAVGHTTTIQGGNGTIAGSGAAIKLQTAAAGDIQVGSSATTGIIAIGGASETGNIILGQYSGSSSSTINIGNSAGASSTQTINLADSGSGINIVNIGSASSSSSTTINAGSGGITLGANTTVTKSNLYQTAATPSFLGGADATGTNTSASGVGNEAFNDIVYYGKYIYIAKAGDSTACSSSAGSAIGCELQIYDATNPTSPIYVGGVDASGSLNSGTDNSAFNGLAISGHYLYVVKANSATNCNTVGEHVGCELQVYDISNPVSPTYVGGADASGATNSGTTSLAFNGISISGNYAFIASAGNASACSSSATGCELKVFNISNPANPAYIGGADASGLTNSGTINSSFSKVRVVGRYAYVAKIGDATDCDTAGDAEGCELQVYDVSTPSTPTFVSGIDAGGTSNSVSGTQNSAFNDVAVSGRYVYVAKTASATACSNAAGSAIGCELQVYDFSNPATPTYVAGVDESGTVGSGTANVTDNDITISGKYAYVTDSGSAGTCSNSSAGGCELQMYDISNPSSPAYLTGMDASGVQGGGVSVSEKQTIINGRYLYMARGASATDCDTSNNASGCELQLYDISGIDAVSINAGSLYTGALTVDQTGIFNQGISVQGGATIGQNLQVTGDVGLDGAVLLQNDINSTSAFQVQNASAVQLFNADTTNLKLTANQANVILTAMSAPTGQAVVAGANTGGSLSGAAGTTYFYKITALNAAGETLPSGEVSIAATSFTPLAVPTAASGSPTTGTDLGIGNYLYELTVVTADGESTVGAESATVTTTTGNQDVTLTVPAVPTGATGFHVYRTALNGASGSELLITTGGCSGVITTTCTDNAADGSLSGSPPGANTARTDLNNATVSWTAVANATSYKIYRGTATGAENAYQTDTASPFTDTGAAGTAAATPTYSSVDQLGIGIAAPTANLDVAGTARFKNTLNNTTSFQVQNSAGTSIFNIDTSNGRVGTAGTNATSTNSAGFTVRTGDATGTTSNSGSLTLDVGTATQTAGSILIGTVNNANAITIGSTTQTTTITLGQATTAVSQTINIESGNGTSSTQIVNIAGGTSTTAGGKTVNIANGIPGTGTTNAVNIGTTGTTTGTVAVKIGSVGAANHTTIIQGGNASTVGSEAIRLQTASTGAVGIASNAVAQTVNIGNITGASGIAAKVGTGNFSLDGVTNSTYSIGASTTTGTITIGGTGQTGNLTLGSSTGTNTEIIAGGSGATTLQIANVQNAGSVSVGAGMTTGTISLGGANQTGTITIGQTSASSTNNTINIGNVIGSSSTQSINIATGTSGIDTVNIGSTNSTSKTTLQGGATSGGVSIIANGGSNTGIIAKVNTDSTNVFQVQGASSTLLDADSSNNQLLVTNTNPNASTSISVSANVLAGSATGVPSAFGSSATWVNSSGTGHVAYVDAIDQKLKFITCGNTACTSYSTTILTNNISFSNVSPPVIATNSLGDADIVYNNNNQVDFIECTSDDCTSNTQTNNLASLSNGCQSFSGTNYTYHYTCDAITTATSGNNGFPDIAYENSSNQISLLVCGNAACSAGNTTTSGIDTTASILSGVSITTDSTHTDPLIAYANSSANLRLAECTTATCSSKTLTTVSVAFPDNVSVALASDGFPRIVFTSSGTTNLIFVQCGNLACSSVTTTTSLGLANFAGQITLAMASSDNWGRISYINGNTGALTFIECGNIACSSGNTSTAIDNPFLDGSTNSTAPEVGSAWLGSDNFERLTYIDSTGNILKFADCTTQSCSSSVNINTITPAADRGKYSSVVMGTDGYARMSYYDATNQDLDFKQCLNATCSSSNTTAITNSGDNIGQYSSIGMGGDGFPVIAFYDASANSGDPMVLHCGNASCTSGNTLTDLSTSANVQGQYITLSIGTDGLPWVAYQDSTASALIVKECTTRTCSSTSGNAYDTIVPQYISMAISSANLPTISYYDSNNGHLKVLECTSNVTTSCSASNINTVDSGTATGQYTSIAIASDGFPRISYYDSTNHVLKFMQCTNASCTSNSINTVDSSSANIGQYTSMEMAPDGFARISYYDVTNADLKFTICTNATCTSNIKATADSSGNVGQYTSLAIGTDGLARVSYYNVTNTALKFFLQTGTGASASGINLGTSGSLFANVNSAVLQSAFALIKPTADTTSVFQIQTASGTAIFNVDTSDNLIAIGTPSSSPTILVLGIKDDTSSDPTTCTNGGIYYNAVSENFRGCEAGNWRELGAGAQIDYAQITSNVATISTTPKLVVSGNPITYDGNTTVKIEFYAPEIVLPGTASQTTFVLHLYEDGSDVGTISQCGYFDGNAGAIQVACNGVVSEFVAPTAGSHTYAIYATNSLNNATVDAGAGGAATFMPAWLRITTQ